MVVTVAAIATSLHARRSKQRARAIATIQDAGGECYPAKRTTALQWWLRWLAGGGEPIARVDLWDVCLSESEIVQLSALSEIERLELVGAQLPRTWTTHVSQLTRLRRLNLDYSSICDDDLEMFSQLPNLTTVSLTDTDITDAGIAHLGKCRALKRVALDRADVSDDGMKILQRMPDLQIITITKSAD